MPHWQPSNLTNHHQKRTTVDRGCFEDLKSLSGRDMTELEYERWSQDAMSSAWGEYECERRNVGQRCYYPMAAYFVDNDLIVTITDSSRNEIRTCYHEHFSRPHGVEPQAGSSLGQKQLRYQKKLVWDEQGKMIRNLKRIRNV